MKQIFTITTLILGFASCKKEAYQRIPDYSLEVQSTLIDSLSQKDFQDLDVKQGTLLKVDSIGLYLFKIPFKSKNVEKDFLMVHTDQSGRVKNGRIIHLEETELESLTENPKHVAFNGKIEMRSLNGTSILESNIVEGYVNAFHPARNTRIQSLIAEDVLPEVVIVSSVNSTGISYSTWINLMTLLPDNGSGGNYYGSLSGNGSSPFVDNGGLGINGLYRGIQTSPVIKIDMETYVDHQAIDLSKYLKCFENIPDNGATCSIEIFTDIPVDNDPTKLFDWQTRSPGHTFIQLKKSNGTQHVIQNIGFYPSSNWKNILDADPVDSKFVDDGGHEFNASLKMNLTPYQLNLILIKAKELSGLKYDMDQFNCTDYALEVFNAARTNEIDIPRYGIPGGVGTYPSRTPQGLYTMLNQMKQNKDPEAANITIAGTKAWVANSDGPCN